MPSFYALTWKCQIRIFPEWLFFKKPVVFPFLQKHSSYDICNVDIYTYTSSNQSKNLKTS